MTAKMACREEENNWEFWGGIFWGMSMLIPSLGANEKGQRAVLQAVLRWSWKHYLFSVYS